jgi:hypothetical protein
VELAVGTNTTVVGGTTSASTDIVVDAPESGAVILNVPILLPAETAIVALVELATVWEVMFEPVPPLILKSGDPGVPEIQDVAFPVKVI